MTRVLWTLDLVGSVLLMDLTSICHQPVLSFGYWIFALTSLIMLARIRNEEENQ